MALLKCEVSEGPRPGFKTVEIPTIEGHVENLTLEERFLVARDHAQYLPVQLIGKDSRYDTCLIQLPSEADSGANRVWVHGDRIYLPEADRVPA